MPAGSPTPSVIVHVFGRTDVGRTREHNEDAFVVADLTRGNATLQPEVRTHVVGDRGTLFMVADGMGGAAAGEIASAMAIEVVLRELSEAFSSVNAPTAEIYGRALKQATATANTEIHSFALEHPEFRGMGTTATIAGVLGDTLYLAQVGDSRAYLVRDGVAKQITKDQSLMQKLIEAGEITEEEAEQSERRNIILQALGPEALVKVDLTHQKVCQGDVLVLCSDGLSGQVRGHEIADVITTEPDLVAVCKTLIDRANENGGPDNITVIAARFHGEGLSVPSIGDAVGHRTFQLATDSGQTAAAAARATLPLGTTNPTIPTPAVTRRTTAKTIVPDEIQLTSDFPAQVTATRRTRGSLIALALLLILLAGVTWWAYQAASSVVAARKDSGVVPVNTTP